MSNKIRELTIEGCTRKDILDAAYLAGKTGAHIAPSLSLVELVLTVLQKMKTDDKFILSKGHGALGYYAAMHQCGLITDEQFASFEKNGGEFPGQPSRSKVNKIQYSSGSLGMGLSYASGLAYANKTARFFVILGDGELNEGSVWEAAGLIKRLNQKNIVAIIDNNGLQSDGRLEDITTINLKKLWMSYGWSVLECDGHNVSAIGRCIDTASDSCEDPTVILAKTIKGKGVSFMEDNNEWHHHELKQEDYEKAIAELGERYGLC